MNTPIKDATVPQSDVEPMRDLLEIAASNGSFTAFGKAVEAAGLGATLRGPGPFTVFAPTDAAFAQLPEGRLQTLCEPSNRAELLSILNYHIVTGRKSLSDVGKWQSARTVQGQAAPIVTAGTDVRIDGAQVTMADLASKNGVIHGIDKVIMPVATSANAKPAMNPAKS